MEDWNTRVKVVNIVTVFLVCWWEINIFNAMFIEDNQGMLLALPFLFNILGIFVLLRGVQISKGPDSAVAKHYMNLVIILFSVWLVYFLLLFTIFAIALATEDRHKRQDDDGVAGALVLVFLGAVGLTVLVGSGFVFLAYKLYTSRLEFGAMLAQQGTQPQYVVGDLVDRANLQ
jgi:hypothetical protein